MANKTSNFPSNQLNNLQPETCAEITSCLRGLNLKGKPETLSELKERIDSYFAFCEEKGLRIGIETLCVSLSITRTTLWRWCEQIDCSAEWAEVCRNAKQFIMAFLEVLTLSGRLNPANSIFYLKNWGNYKDSISFDESIPQTSTKKALSVEELAKQLEEEWGESLEE